MRIKTTKKMRLDELIKYVWENDIRNVDFVSNLGTDVYADNNALIVMPETYYQKGETYNVVVEEELTEETVFKELHEYFWDLEDGVGVTEILTNESIAGILEEHDEETVSLSITARRRADNEPILIWSKDAGIPEEGVIECS